jgi:uncharacterized radical SAM superfamily Fe-S cluster-containing enzyme
LKNPESEEILNEVNTLFNTKSVCPVCLCELTAAVYADDDGIYMEKVCPEHGHFRTLIWADTEAHYRRWMEYGGIDISALPQSAEEVQRRLKSVSFSCGACVQSSSSALMTTNRCNMDCPICFTRDKKDPVYEPDLESCRTIMAQYRAKAGEDAILEFCGGEPTVRPDLCNLAETARDMGFDFIQLNTNGIRLAESADYCVALKKNGIATVYLGFDGMSEKPYFAKYGKPMLDIKKAAVRNCAEAGLAIVLVTCVIPGENDGELGAIVSFAKKHMPAVRGVFFQPISYFGIYPRDNIRRITIPDIIRCLERQLPELHAEDFSPGSYEHPQCSFNAYYLKDKAGTLRPLTHMGLCGSGRSDVHRLRQMLRATWLPNDKKTLTIGGMAFQDAWNIDLLRIARCSIQIIGKSGTMFPLCSKYLSGCGGVRLLPEIS